MTPFEFIIIIVIITTLGKVAVSVGGPMVDKLGDLVKELSASKRVEQERGDLGAEAVDELERRLARIEDRLDFLEELRAPDRPRALGRGAKDAGAGKG